MIRRALALSAAVLLVAAPPLLGAVIRLGGGSLTVFTMIPELPIVAASIEMRPGTLARHDRGQGQGPPVTVLVEAPDKAFDVRRIVPGSIRLCRDGPLCDTGAAAGAPRVGDEDHDGIRDLEVTFSRADVLALVADLPAPADITFVVSAVLRAGDALSGTDTVTLVDRERCAPGEDEPHCALEPPGSPEDASPSPSASPDGDPAEPEPSIVPAPTPDGSAPPSSEPSPPGEEPPTPDPGSEPTIEPPPSPAATAEPTPVATPSPASTAPSTSAPTPDPADEPAASPSPGNEAP